MTIIGYIFAFLAVGLFVASIVCMLKAAFLSGVMSGMASGARLTAGTCKALGDDETHSQAHAIWTKLADDMWIKNVKSARLFRRWVIAVRDEVPR